jgi:cyclopropane fatty-acyl-phospholipid synthase-like methyltransferase
MDPSSVSSLELERHKLITYLCPRKDQTLLDLGCSNGNGISLLSNQYNHIIGVDLSPSSVENRE